MSTTAQIAANRENAQHSTGPKTEAGKAASSQNHHRHGLTGGVFQVQLWENESDYSQLLVSLLNQHQPGTPFEEILVQKMAQHFWLAQRAIRLQENCFADDFAYIESDENIKLYLRYQTTHERTYHKLSDELRKLRNETRKQEIGFVSQLARKAAELRRQTADKRKENEDIRHAAAETRRQEIHLKRLAVLDTQIARLATPKQAPRFAPDAQISAGNSLHPRSQAA